MTRRNELLVAAPGAVLVLLVGTLLAVRPEQQAASEARADRNGAVAAIQALQDELRALEALKASEAELRAQAELAKAESPPTPALPALVDALEYAGADPDRIPPRSVLVQSVSVTGSGAAGATATTTPGAAATAGQLQASINLTVFQLAGSSAAQPSGAATAATSTTQVR